MKPAVRCGDHGLQAFHTPDISRNRPDHNCDVPAVGRRNGVAGVIEQRRHPTSPIHVPRRGPMPVESISREWHVLHGNRTTVDLERVESQSSGIGDGHARYLGHAKRFRPSDVGARTIQIRAQNGIGPGALQALTLQIFPFNRVIPVNLPSNSVLPGMQTIM